MKSIDEGLLHLYFDRNFMPLIWRVLFSESHQSNHLLFPALVGVPQAAAGEARANIEGVCEATLNLLRSSDLGAMQAIVAALALPEQRLLFQIYLRLLAGWKRLFEDCLH